MKRLKKLLVLFAAAVSTLCFAIGFAACSDANDGTEGLEYQFDTDRRHCVVTGMGDLLAKEIIIASNYKGYTVTKIASGAFYNCDRLTKVTIPSTIKEIGGYAFDGCSSLTSIEIPDSVTLIKGGAFAGCSSLENIEIPDSVVQIEGNAFSGCTSLKNIILSRELTCIERATFAGCESLEAIRIPDKVTSVKQKAFENCTALKNISLPDYLTSIDSDAFKNTAYYNDRKNWESGLLYYGNYLIEVKDNNAESLTIKEGTKLIGERAFSSISSLKNVTIPNTVKSIGDRAFEACRDLESITVNGGNTVYHSNGNCLIETESKTLIKGCKNSVIPNDGSVTVISDKAFLCCNGLGRITIPDGVTEIGASAFYACVNLERIVIPNSVKKIGEYALYYCTGLTDILYYGSVEDWQNVKKGQGWDTLADQYTVTCTYGQIEKG